MVYFALILLPPCDFFAVISPLSIPSEEKRFGATLIANTTFVCPLQLPAPLDCLAVQKAGKDLFIHCSNDGNNRQRAAISTKSGELKQLASLADNDDGSVLLALLGNNLVEIWQWNANYNNNIKLQQSLPLMQMQQMALAVHDGHVYLAVLTMSPAAGIHIYR